MELSWYLINLASQQQGMMSAIILCTPFLMSDPPYAVSSITLHASNVVCSTDLVYHAIAYCTLSTTSTDLVCTMLLRIRLRACAMSGTDVVYGTTFFSFSARCTAGEPYCDSGVHAGRPCPVIGATCAVLSPYAPTTQCPVLTYSTVLCDIQY